MQGTRFSNPAVCFVALCGACSAVPVADRPDSGGSASFDAAVVGDAGIDAGTSSDGGVDAGSSADGGVDGGPQPGCVTQRVDSCFEQCLSVVGTFFDGTFCKPIVCCCQGPDCAGTYSNWQDCFAANSSCLTNICAATGGYCDYGDAVIPTCLPGYGKNLRIPQGTCGLGICCAPCPVEGAAATYVAHDPNACATIDYRCEHGWMNFENECGCGCIAP